MDRWTPTGVRARTAPARPAPWTTTPPSHWAAAVTGMLLTLAVGVATVTSTLAEHRPAAPAPSPTLKAPAAAGGTGGGAELLRTWGLDLDPQTGYVVPAQSRLPALPGLVGGDVAVPSAPGDMAPTVAAGGITG